MACDDKNVAIGSTMKANLGNSQTRYLEKVVTLLKLLILGGGGIYADLDNARDP